MIISTSMNKDKNNPKVYHNPFIPCHIREFKDLLNIMNTQAVTHFIYKDNKRKANNILPHQDYKIYFLDIDDENYYCDEVETILKNKNIEFIVVPSQSFPTKNYKKHFAIRLSNTLPIPNENLSFENISKHIFNIIGINFNKVDTSVAKDPARFLAPASANPDFTDYDLYSKYYPGKPLEIDFNSLYKNTPMKAETISNSFISSNKGYFKGYPIVGKTKKGNRIVNIPNSNKVSISKEYQHYFNNNKTTLKEIKEVLIKYPQIKKIIHSCPICNKEHTNQDTTSYGYSIIVNNSYYSFCSGQHCENNTYVTEFKKYLKLEPLNLPHSIRAYHIAIKSNSKLAKTFFHLFGEPHDKEVDKKVTYNIYYYNPTTIKHLEDIGIFKALYLQNLKCFNLKKKHNHTKYINIDEITQLNNIDTSATKTIKDNILKAKSPSYNRKETFLFSFMYRKRIESIEMFMFILLYHKNPYNNPNTLNTILSDIEPQVNYFIQSYENFQINIFKYKRDALYRNTKRQTKKATEVRKQKAQTKKEIVFQMLAQDKYKQGTKFKRTLILQDLEKQGIKISEVTFKRYLSEYKKL